MLVFIFPISFEATIFDELILYQHGLFKLPKGGASGLSEIAKSMVNYIVSF